jgi:type I restriction enzyme S subunit
MVPLSDGLITNLQTGFACGEHNRDGRGIVHIRPMNVTSEGQMELTNVKYVPTAEADREDRLVRAGDVIFNNTNSPELVGKTALYSEAESRAFSNHMTRLRANPERVRPRYLALTLHQLWREGYFADKCNNHVSQASISRAVLLDTEIPLPTIDVQDSLLLQVSKPQEQVNSARERLASIPILLKHFRQSVLAAACSGQLTADWRGTDDLTGWEDIPAQDICERVQSGSTPKEGFQAVPGVPFLKVYNLVDQRLDFDYKPQFVSSEVFGTRSMSRSTAMPGDVLMNIVGPPLGKVAVVTNQYPEWTFNQALTAFRPSKQISTEWLYLILCSGVPYEDILMLTRGSAGQSNISLTQCREMILPVPPVPEQVEIVSRVESFFALVDSTESRLEEATRLVERITQAILAKAFRGELFGGS